MASHCPGGPVYAAQLRVLNIGRLLRRLGNVEFVLAADNPIDPLAIEEASEEFGDIQILSAPDAGSGGIVDRVRHELDPSFLYTFPAAMSAENRAALLERSAKADLVWVHSIRTANATGISRWPKSVLDIDDLPSLQYRSAADSESRLLRRLLDLRMSWIWRRRELHLQRRFEVLTVCSQRDKVLLGNTEQVHVIRNGFEAPPMHGTSRPSEPRLGFIGTLNWEPNLRGVEWLIESVWPSIRAAVPDAQLRLVGAGSERFNGRSKHVTGLGYVADASAEISSWTGMLVPLQVGAGTRIKIAEGFAKRVPVVSTSVGAYGYDITDGVEFLLADEPVAFARASIRLLKDPGLGERLSEQAHRRFMNEWTWDAQFPAVKAAVERCLWMSRGGAR